MRECPPRTTRAARRLEYWWSRPGAPVRVHSDPRTTSLDLQARRLHVLVVRTIVADLRLVRQTIWPRRTVRISYPRHQGVEDDLPPRPRRRTRGRGMNVLEDQDSSPSDPDDLVLKLSLRDEPRNLRCGARILSDRPGGATPRAAARPGFGVSGDDGMFAAEARPHDPDRLLPDGIVPAVRRTPRRRGSRAGALPRRRLGPDRARGVAVKDLDVRCSACRRRARAPPRGRGEVIAVGRAFGVLRIKGPTSISRCRAGTRRSAVGIAAASPSPTPRSPPPTRPAG
jgi:hypothetical protein